MNKIIELVSLASIVPPPNHEVSGGFNAIVDGKQVRVRAVLERTVIIEHHEGGERSVVRKDNCMVKPSAVAFVLGNPNNGVGPRQWRRVPGKPGGRRAKSSPFGTLVAACVCTLTATARLSAAPQPVKIGARPA